MNDIRPGMRVRWVPGGRARVVYTVDRVQKFGADEYALLIWTKNTRLPGAMWVTARALRESYAEVDA